ncbi:MAG TPA: 1-phosphofructokinase family hexose kinase [Candidatus Atribacteria bacterium]|nr:1-phosphofructokinase family hexose kinase [Candidatus Atribacteria bacterium]
MIFVLCANPALDRLLIMKEINLNEVNRASQVVETAGGKGINVARAIKRKGGNPHLLLFEGGSTGERIKNSLEEEGFLLTNWPSGETRVTTVIHEEKTERHTVINEPGPLVSVSAVLTFLRFLENNLQKGDCLVLSGSLPRGVRLDFYALLTGVAKRKGALSVVDTSGEPLRRALSASPFMIKPNARETEEVLGFSISSWEDKLKAVKIFQNQGVELVILSDGKRGVVAAYQGEIWKVRMRKETEGGGYSIGSGDTLVGVMVKYLEEGRNIEGSLAAAVSCGLANTFYPGGGIFDLEKAEELEKNVLVERIKSQEAAGDEHSGARKKHRN